MPTKTKSNVIKRPIIREEELPPDRWLSEASAARYLDCSRSFLSNMRCEGRGPIYYRKSSKFLRYKLSDLQAYMEDVQTTPYWTRAENEDTDND